MNSTPYTDGTYSVQVREDGAILVKPGDWLSKYAAAINHDKYALDDFYWPPDRVGGDLRTIENKNLIAVGDTVIYKPTWTKYWQGRRGRPEGLDLGTFLKRLQDEGGVRGDRLARMSGLLTGAKWRDVSEAEAHWQLLYLIMETGKGFGHASGHPELPILNRMPAPLVGFLAFLSVFQFTFQAMVVWLDAQESSLRFQGLRAIAYATTAFAFGDPPPAYPYKMECNYSGGTWRGVIPLSRLKLNWLDVASRTTMQLAADFANRGVDKQVYQMWIRWEANNRRDLALVLMEEIARSMSKMLPVDRTLFMSPTPIYPNDWPDNLPARAC